MWPLRALVLLVAVAAPSAALARDFRVNEIPNGVHFRCQNCHNDNSGKDFTPFGSDAKSHLVDNDTGVASEHVLWDNAWCKRDSDGDGKTNGEELGDPDCTWSIGDPNPAALVTNPGSTGDGTGCGNDSVDSGESCDGMKTHAFSCAELNLGKGLLGCTADCAYDTSKCSGGPVYVPPDFAEEGCSTSAEAPSFGAGATSFALVAVAFVAARRRRPSATK